MARLVTAEEFGLFSFALVIASVSYTLADLGIAKTALRYIPVFRVRAEVHRIKGLVRLLVLCPLGAGTLVGAALWVGAGHIASLVGELALKPVLLPAAVGVPLMAASIASLEATRALGHAKFFVYAKLIAHPLANLALVVLLAQPQLTAERALWAWVGASGLTLALSFEYLRRSLPDLSNVRARLPGMDLVRFAAPALGVNLFGYLQLRIDIIMVGLLLPASAIGVYSAASQVVLAFAVATMAVGALFNPIAAGLWESGRTADLRTLYRAGSRLVAYLGLPVLLVVCLAPQAVLSLFGTEYVQGTDALVVLAVAAFLGSIVGLSGPLLLMGGYPLRELGNSALAVCCNMLLALLFVPSLHIVGAALATGTTILAINVARSLQVRSRLHAFPVSKSLVRALIAAGIALLGGVILGELLAPGARRVVLQLAVAFGTLAVGLRIFGLPEQDRALLQAFRRSSHGEAPSAS